MWQAFAAFFVALLKILQIATKPKPEVTPAQRVSDGIRRSDPVAVAAGFEQAQAEAREQNSRAARVLAKLKGSKR